MLLFQCGVETKNNPEIEMLGFSSLKYFSNVEPPRE